MHKALKIATRSAGFIVSIALLFFLSAWIGAMIPRNAGWEEPQTGVTIMVETNGIHTGIIIPLVTPQKDWREQFPASDLDNPNRDYTHISVSFGEREVFLNTPHLRDITLSTAIGAAFGGDGLLHVAHYVRPAPADNVRELTISETQYARLVAQIEQQAPPFSPEREVFDGYGAQDVFYDAPETYHLGNTCNQWTANKLAAAGIKTGLWTPLSGGVMQWVEPPVPAASTN